MFYIANCSLESPKHPGNEMDLVSKVSGMKSTADSIRTTTSSVQITGLRNSSVNVQARQNVANSGGSNSGSQVGGGLGGSQITSHIVPISQSSVKQVSSSSTGSATLTLIQSSAVGSGGASTPGGLVLTRPHLPSSPSHHVQYHLPQNPLISVATGTTYHVPRGAAAVANIASPRSAVTNPIIRASSASGLQVSGGPSGSSGATCVGYVSPGGALLRPSSSPSASILPRITSPPASSTTTISAPSSVATSVVTSTGAATAWVSSKAATATPVGGAVIVQPPGHHPRPYSQIRTGGMTVTAKLPLQGHRLQAEATPVRTTTASSTSSSHTTAISSSPSNTTGLVKQSISQHVAQHHIPEKTGYFKTGGASSSASGAATLGAVTISQVLSQRVCAVSGLSGSAPPSSSAPSGTFPLHYAPVSSVLPSQSSPGPASTSTALPSSSSSATTTAPPSSGLHGMVSTTRIALAGARGHQQIVGPKVIAQPVHGPSSIQITQVPAQVPSSTSASAQQSHAVPSSTSTPTPSSSLAPSPSQSPQHVPLQTTATQQGAGPTIHTVVPICAMHQQAQPQQHTQHPVQPHQGTAIAITTVVTRAFTYTGPTVPGTVVAGQTLGRPTTMLSVPAIPSASAIMSTTSSPSPLATATPPTTTAPGSVPVGKVFTSPLATLSLGRVGLDVTSSGDHTGHQPLVSLQHQATQGVYIHTSHPRASPAPQITTVARGERSQVVAGSSPATVVQPQQLTTSPSPPSTLSSTAPSATNPSTTITVATSTNTAATYALPTTRYYYGASGYTVGVARPFSGTGGSGANSAMATLPGNAGSSFVPIQAVPAAVISSSSVAPSAPSSVVAVAPASPASITTIRPVGQPGLTTHQVHGIMTTGSGPVRFNPVMVVDSTRSASGAQPFLSEEQFVEVAGTGNGIVGAHFSGSSSLQPKHPITTLAPPPTPPASIVSVQASPIKPNSSPRPSILRKRDCDGTPMKAQKNLGPTLAALTSASSSTISSSAATIGASAITSAASSLASLGASSHSPPPSPSHGAGNHHTSSSPTSSSSSSSSSSSAGSTTISATSSPGGEVDVGEDSLPPQLLAPPVPGSSATLIKSEPMDDMHPPTDSAMSGVGAQARPFIPAPPPAQVVVEMSPRKKPRKQQLTGNELQEPKFSEDEMEFLSEAKVKKQVKNVSLLVNASSMSSAVPVSAPPHPVAKRPSGMSLLNGYRHAWKSRQNHFVRPGDVRPREERRPSIADIAAQKRVHQKLNGWKVHHLSAQMEELAELEIQVFEKLTEMLGMMERKQPTGGKELEKDVNRINELIKGNLQRSKVIKDQMQEAKSQVMKIFDHKDLVSDILSKNASKRTVKKREKS
ncbi:histone deacetylase complex subunit SAP130 isoform X2 [Hetaerina americana]|uniref:histone deacetylase complex subunit SAP130 isoform X2 n=1 Tax=Hetaerina americana TaxID=62018 RepID=UPI003A7F103C